MPNRRFLTSLIAGLGVAAIYLIAGKIGLSLALVNASASAVWPPTGIALAAFLVLAYRIWPGVLLGAFLVNITTAGNAATSVGIAVGTWSARPSRSWEIPIGYSKLSGMCYQTQSSSALREGG